MAEKKIRCWHFLQKNKRLRYGEQTLIKPGKTVSVEGDLKLCSNGLHASRRVIDALDYAPGPILCRVDVWGDLIDFQYEGKLCGRHRKVLWMVNAELALRRLVLRIATEGLNSLRVAVPSECFAALAQGQEIVDGKSRPSRHRGRHDSLDRKYLDAPCNTEIERAYHLARAALAPNFDHLSSCLISLMRHTPEKLERFVLSLKPKAATN